MEVMQTKPPCLWRQLWGHIIHYDDVIMSTMASQITSVSIVCSTVCPGTDQRKHQRSASLAFVWGIHWWPVNSPHKKLVTRKLSPFDDVIMAALFCYWLWLPKCEIFTSVKHLMCSSWTWKGRTLFTDGKKFRVPCDCNILRAID